MSSATVQPSGPELRELRVRLGVPARAVANVMRVSDSAIYNTERAAAVGPQQATRYRSALRVCVDSRGVPAALRAIVGEATAPEVERAPLAAAADRVQVSTTGRAGPDKGGN